MAQEYSEWPYSTMLDLTFVMTTFLAYYNSIKLCTRFHEMYNPRTTCFESCGMAWSFPRMPGDVNCLKLNRQLHVFKKKRFKTYFLTSRIILDDF